MLLEFSKMQALGNDFVFIHNIEPKKLTKSVI
jgi:diaminopimelate epimerase